MVVLMLFIMQFSVIFGFCVSIAYHYLGNYHSFLKPGKSFVSGVSCLEESQSSIPRQRGLCQYRFDMKLMPNMECPRRTESFTLQQIDNATKNKDTVVVGVPMKTPYAAIDRGRKVRPLWRYRREDIACRPQQTWTI